MTVSSETSRATPKLTLVEGGLDQNAPPARPAPVPSPRAPEPPRHVKRPLAGRPDDQPPAA